MKKIPRLPWPSPSTDQEAHDLFTSEGAPPRELPRLLACPSPSEGPQRYRLPLWRLIGKPK